MAKEVGIKQHPPVTAFPTLRCLPDFVKGTPVALLIFLFAFVIPVARFQENPPRFAIVLTPYFINRLIALLASGITSGFSSFDTDLRWIFHITAIRIGVIFLSSLRNPYHLPLGFWIRGCRLRRRYLGFTWFWRRCWGRG